jgi:cell wall assembly regulator SMI1
MKATWDRIHVWLGEHAPQVLAGLRPGAGEEQIRAAENALGVALPEDVRTAYRVHDGEGAEGTAPSPGVLFGRPWLSLDAVVKDWRTMQGLLDRKAFPDTPANAATDGPVRADWWNPCWLPVADAGMGVFCIDLAPSANGRVGQIITVWNDGARGFLASSFADWLDDLASELEAGEFTTSPDYSGLVRVGELDEDETE